MSITLIVSKKYDKNLTEINDVIDEEEWEKFVESQDYLRFRSEPYVVNNPVTGEAIRMDAPEGATEVLVGNEWHPFLIHKSGELRMRYSQVFEDPNNPVRIAVAGIAGYFSALIMHDASDEILKW